MTENAEIKKVESLVATHEDVEWPRDTTNPIINSAVIKDNLDAIFTIWDKQYNVRSPNRQLMKKMRNQEIDPQKMNPEQREIFADLQEAIVQDMIPDLPLDGSVRISDNDFDMISIACWEFYGFLKRRLMASQKDLPSRKRGTR